MGTIATNVQWGTGPKIYFDFSYEKKRDGSTQYYDIKVSCRALSGGSYFGYPIYVKISLDGLVRSTYTLKNADPMQWNSAIIKTTGWLAVDNKTSGTTAISINIYSGSGSTRNETYNYTLDIDPAASTISCTTANIESNPTISITRADPSFTHTISYVFGSLRGDIAVKTSDTKITNWTIPAEFYTQIPDDKKGEGTLTCITYSGNTPIGSNPCKLSVTTDEAKCKPTVSGEVYDSNQKTCGLTGTDHVLIRYCSSAWCNLGAILNKSAGSMPIKTINNISAPDGFIEIHNVETNVFEFYAQDSRGYFNSHKVALPMVPYVKLTANVTSWRVDPTSGNAMLKVEGNYFKGNFGAKDNTLTIKYRHGDGEEKYAEATISDDNTYTVTVPLSGLDYTRAFNFEVVVSDEISTLTKSTTILKGIPVFDWGENDFNFNVPVTINGVNILDKLAELERLISQ